LVAGGEIVIAAGGGGIPVTRNESGEYSGVEAVIDKDRTSAMLASELGADLLAILTNVDQVQRDFGKPTAQPLSRLTLDDARSLIAEKQFPAGSMGPKIEAAVQFLSASKLLGAEVLITSCERIAEALTGATGTRLVRSL
jgi:carbamate kinase